MEIITFMNTYGITALLAGAIACLVCGALKIPIVKLLKKYSVQKELSEKSLGDKLRNICNMIVLASCTLFLSVWYGVLNGVDIFLTAEIYTDILTAFTAAKLLYMLYEGAGKVSVKQQLHLLVTKMLSKKSENKENQNVLALVQMYLTDQAELPLTEAQIQGLSEVLNTIKIDKEKK